jgi:hypothetical protein
MKDGQTFGQWLNWDFKTNGSLKIKDKNGNDIYHETSKGYWFKSEFDSNGDVIYFKNSGGNIVDNRIPSNHRTQRQKISTNTLTMKDGQTIGQWLNWDFKTNGNIEIKDKNGDVIYFEESDGYWFKTEYDSQRNLIYHEDSSGHIEDNRIPEIIEHNGRKYQLIPNQNQNQP